VNYLDSLKDHIRLNPTIKDGFVRELRGHLDDAALDLQNDGISADEAQKIAVKFLGSPRVIAQQIYEVYSQGSWRETLFAIIPHFLTSSLLLLRWIPDPIWLAVILGCVIATIIYGWCRGKPAWLFSWLGYLVIPIIMGGVALLYLPGNLAWMITLVYMPVAIFILVIITRQIMKIDWLFISLLLLPVPVVLGWVIVLNKPGTFSGLESDTISWIALSFAVLGLAVATFIRVKQRWIKTGAMFVCSILVLAVVALVSDTELSIWVWIFLSILTLLHLLGPVIFEKRESNSSPQYISHN